jgi:hypothetical protein
MNDLETMHEMLRDIAQMELGIKRISAAVAASKSKITGNVTKKTLEAWMEANRPDLDTYDNDGTKGYYRKNAGPAASFVACGKTWRHVAEELGAVTVYDRDGVAVN